MKSNRPAKSEYERLPWYLVALAAAPVVIIALGIVAALCEISKRH